MNFQRVLLKAYGAELILTDPALGMNGAIQRANEIAQSVDNSFVPQQVNNTPSE